MEGGEGIDGGREEGRGREGGRMLRVREGVEAGREEEREGQSSLGSVRGRSRTLRAW